jgi:hypothetical protein
MSTSHLYLNPIPSQISLVSSELISSHMAAMIYQPLKLLVFLSVPIYLPAAWQSSFQHASPGMSLAYQIPSAIETSAAKQLHPRILFLQAKDLFSKSISPINRCSWNVPNSEHDGKPRLHLSQCRYFEINLFLLSSVS